MGYSRTQPGERGLPRGHSDLGFIADPTSSGGSSGSTVSRTDAARSRRSRTSRSTTASTTRDRRTTTKRRRGRSTTAPVALTKADKRQLRAIWGSISPDMNARAEALKAGGRSIERIIRLLKAEFPPPVEDEPEPKVVLTANELAELELRYGSPLPDGMQAEGEQLKAQGLNPLSELALRYPVTEDDPAYVPEVIPPPPIDGSRVVNVHASPPAAAAPSGMSSTTKLAIGGAVLLGAFLLWRSR